MVANQVYIWRRDADGNGITGRLALVRFEATLEEADHGRDQRNDQQYRRRQKPDPLTHTDARGDGAKKQRDADQRRVHEQSENDAR